jgi:hypothetical protein
MKYIYKTSKLLMFFVFLLFLTNVYSSALTITQETNNNQINDKYYISKHTSLEIIFNINTDYEKTSVREINPYLKIDVEVLDATNSLEIIASDDFIYFSKKINKDFVLKIKPNNYVNQTTRTILSFSLYDEYGNLLDVQKRYLVFVANNSETQYLTKTGQKPDFIGYTLSKDKVFLEENKESFVDVNIYATDYEYYGYGLICENNNNLKTTIVKKNNITNRIYFSIDETLNYDNNVFIISCKIKDKYETHVVSPIAVVVDTNKTTEVQEQQTQKKISSFISLPDLSKLDFKNILIMVIVILMLVVIFSKNK